eukprot:SAG25_NODE_74_length_16997_cov_287.503166_10_plen_110_part_00
MFIKSGHMRCNVWEYVWKPTSATIPSGGGEIVTEKCGDQTLITYVRTRGHNDSFLERVLRDLLRKDRFFLRIHHHLLLLKSGLWTLNSVAEIWILRFCCCGHLVLRFCR